MPHPLDTMSPENSRKLVAVIHDLTTNPMNAHFYVVRELVKARGIEPRAGFTANELSVELSADVEVSVTSRNRGHGASVVRWRGEIVLHQCDSMGHAVYVPGDWEDVVLAAARAIEGEQIAKSCQLIEGHRAKQQGGFIVQKIAA